MTLTAFLLHFDLGAFSSEKRSRVQLSDAPQTLSCQNRSPNGRELDLNKK